MRTAGVQVRNVLALGVQRVGGDHHTGQVNIDEGVQQRDELVNLAALALRRRIHADLPQDDPAVMVDHRKQVAARHRHTRRVELAGSVG
jgi:hypothetical protein